MKRRIKQGLGLTMKALSHRDVNKGLSALASRCTRGLVGLDGAVVLQRQEYVNVWVAKTLVQQRPHDHIDIHSEAVVKLIPFVIQLRVIRHSVFFWQPGLQIFFLLSHD